MNAAEKRILLPLLKRVKAGETSFRMRSAAEHLIYRFSKPASKSKKAASARKEEKKASGWAQDAALRRAVFHRAKGICELAGCWATATDWDHWLGGSGRRHEKQSIETCWALCSNCHRSRTDNFPSVAFWNTAFKAHCDRHGYPVIEHIIHHPVSAAAGGSK